MRLRLTIFWTLFCGAAWGQGQLPTPLQSCPAGTSCTMHNNVVTGSLVYIGAHSEGALTTPTNSGTASMSSWTLVDSHTGGAFAYLWCATVSSGGTLTTTLTGSLSFQGQVATEFPAFAGLSCTKDASANGATASGTVTTSNITNSKNGDLMLCYMSNFHSASQPIPTNGGSFRAIRTQNGSDAGGLAYRFAGTNGSYNCVFDGGSDASGGYVVASFAPSAITMATSAFPSAALTNSYSFTVQCVGGAGAYTYSASSLPAGLSINSSTGAITGTPTGGTTTPTVQCTDGSTTATLNSQQLVVNSSVGTMNLASSCAATSTVSTCSLGTVNSGGCVAVSESIGNGVPGFPPIDSLSTVYKLVGTQSYSAQLGFEDLYIGPVTSTGSNTVTAAQMAGSGAGAFAAVYIPNCQSFYDVASSNAGISAGTATISGNGLTTLAPGSEIWASIIAFTNGTTYTAGTGFSGDANQTAGFPMQGIHANESTVGSYTPSFNQNGNTNGSWVVWGIALRPSTSGIVNTNHRRAWVIQR